MDFDISHLSPKARTRLGRYFRKIHLPKTLWVIPVAVIVIGIGLAFYLDQLSNHNNIMPAVIGIFIFVFLRVLCLGVEERTGSQ